MEHEEHKVEQDQIREDQYDGIQEYDNNLPKWWLGIFYLSIIFGIVYWVHYYVFQTGNYQKEEMEKELALHKAMHSPVESAEKVSVTDEEIRALVNDGSAMADAKNTWTVHCTACHGSLGGGGIGPNMTDEYWIHGGKPTDILHTITEGVPEKGMISWKTMLTSKQIQNVAAYVLTLQGNNPPNAKAPQGEKG